MIEHIHTVTVASNHEGQWFWTTILPPLIAAIVPAIALIYNAGVAQAQIKTTAGLAREQINASTKVAERQAEIANKQAEVAREKLVSENFETRFEAWRTLDVSAWEYYKFIYASSRQDAGSDIVAFIRKYDDAALRVSFLFGQDVRDEVEGLRESLHQLNIMWIAGASSNQNEPLREQALKGGLTSADAAVQAAIKDVRAAVQTYTVYTPDIVKSKVC